MLTSSSFPKWRKDNSVFILTCQQLPSLAFTALQGIRKTNTTTQATSDTFHVFRVFCCTLCSVSLGSVCKMNCKAIKWIIRYTIYKIHTCSICMCMSDILIRYIAKLTDACNEAHIVPYVGWNWLWLWWICFRFSIDLSCRYSCWIEHAFGKDSFAFIVINNTTILYIIYIYYISYRRCLVDISSGSGNSYLRYGSVLNSIR